MRQLKKIIVGHDLRRGGVIALRSAVVLAQRCGAALRLVHILEPQHAYQRLSVYAYGCADNMELGAPIPPLAPGEIESEWQGFLSGLSLGNVEWEKQTEEGQAGFVISRQAEQSHADLIVMGTHGRSGLAYMLLGSVAEKVVRAVSCPVLTIRPDAFQFEMP
jgi:nucleotide-binding universal stress UspA family protein